MQHITFRHWIGVKSDSFFGTLYADFKPFFDTYLEKYDNWKIAQGLSKGETSQLSLYFNEFVEKLRAWDAIVQVVFLKKHLIIVASSPVENQFFTMALLNKE